jgi:type IV pilus assembly protein PilB
MNIAERRIPQDGRIVKQVGDNQVDMRVSSLPTHHGESSCCGCSTARRSTLARKPRPDRRHLRLHHRAHREAQRHLHRHRPHRRRQDHHPLRRPAPHQHHRFQAAHRRGPGRIRHRRHHPDPGQRGDRPDFPRVLRAFLRQDPDRIMVGEMRDKETARSHPGVADRPPGAFHPAHQRRARRGHPPDRHGLRAVPRRRLARGVLAQRLVRTICKDCKVPYEPNEAILSQLGLSPTNWATSISTPVPAATTCGQTGYRGRRAFTSCLTSPIRSAN